MSDAVDEIVREFELSGAQEKIPKDKVLRWMLNDELDALGAVYALMNSKHVSRINPELTFEEYKTFVFRYYERCFIENADSEWADSRYTAGYGLMSWFKSMWIEDSGAPISVFEEIKAWLADLYRNSDADVRLAIVHAPLEHLFEEKKIKKFFSDWKDDPILAEAYANAALWVEGLDKFGIDSPTRRDK